VTDDDFLQGALEGEVDEAELAARLAAEPALARRYLELARDEALLHEVAAASRDARALAPRSAVGPRWVLPAAAALLVSVLAAVLFRPDAAGPGPWIDVESPSVRGLRAEYFEKPDLTVLRDTRIDPGVAFEWEKLGPKGRPFSVRWTGRVVAPTSGTWTFHVVSDDGVRLYVDDRLAIDGWREQKKSETTGTAELHAGRPAGLRLEYFNLTGPGSAHLLWSGPGTPRQPIPLEALFPAPPGGSGLKAEYFDDDSLGRLRLRGVDPTIDLVWGEGSPHPSIRTDGFSARWTGWIVPRASGTWNFFTLADDGVRLWIDDRLIIDDWKVHGSEEHAGRVELEAGRRHAIRLEYFDRVSMARITLSWSGPGQPKDVVPRSALHPAP
jgi:hypothetical protein